MLIVRRASGAAIVPAVDAGVALKKGVKRLLGLSGTRQVQILSGPARGVTMTLDFAGHTPMYLGMFEWELHEFFRTVLEDAALVFDVGGYVGYDALMFAANCTGQVVTFEPDPERAGIVKQNIAQNPQLEPRITVNPLAIEANDGPASTTLDSLRTVAGDPDFIKIDIDGGELDALRGGIGLLRDKHPHLVVETHSLDLETACGNLLVECGYTPVIKHNRKVWREHRGGAPHNRWLLAAGDPARPTETSGPALSVLRSDGR